LDKNVNTIKKAQVLLDTSKKTGLEVNADKTKCMLICCHQNAEHNLT